MSTAASIDWENLGFSYMSTPYHVRYTWRDGVWSAGELVDEPYIQMHIAATALHYGQAGFEGMKAFMGKDGKVRIFRPDENAKRMALTAKRVCMAEVPPEMFVEACSRVVSANRDFVPPYGTGGAMYIRPLLFGTGARIGLQPSDEYTFIVMVVPVGPYYKGGLTPVAAKILTDYDRAAPHGVGHVKVAGNYAAGMEPNRLAAAQGFPIVLFLDAKEHRYVEEFGTSNFIAITTDDHYVTAESCSILQSITNMSLQQLAIDLGMPVEVRPIELSEVASFAEVGACGTAVVLTPICKIVSDSETIEIGSPSVCGPTLQKLYDTVQQIQYGEIEDRHGWNLVLD